jgi:acyl-CoA thioester hydrolase
MKKRIYYHDTDCGQVVYYANYLKYFEEARTEHFAEKGFAIKDLACKGVLFVVARQEIDYKFPAFYGDVLDIRTAVAEIGAAKIVFEHETLNQNGKLVNKAKTILVCVDDKLRPQTIPDDLRAKLVG